MFHSLGLRFITKKKTGEYNTVQDGNSWAATSIQGYSVTAVSLFLSSFLCAEEESCVAEIVYGNVEYSPKNNRGTKKLRK